MVNQVRQFENIERNEGQETTPRILAFRPETEIRAERDIEQIAQLKAQVLALREELAKAQKQVAAYEQLLKNARQRERELQLSLNQKR